MSNLIEVTEKAFIRVNKALVKEVGLVPATIYGELVSTHLYWQSQNKLTTIDGKEYFYCTVDDMEEKTAIKKDSQLRAIKVLEKSGLVETRRKRVFKDGAIVSYRFFHIPEMFIENLFGQYQPNCEPVIAENSVVSEIAKPQFTEIAICDTNNKQLTNKHINNITNDNIIKETGEQNVNDSAFKESETLETTEIEINATVKAMQEEVMKQLQANQTIQNEAEAIRLLTDSANEFYAKFSIGRWDKKTWIKLVGKFVSETVASKRYLNVTYGKVKGYVFKAIQNMVRHHDYKHSEEFQNFKEFMVSQEYKPATNLPNGMYNWLEIRE